MRHVLVLGAGQSAPFLIRQLLQDSERFNWFVTVADRDHDLARLRVAGHPRSNAVHVDATDVSLLHNLVSHSDVVVNFLSPVFQHSIARTCVELGTAMVSASYRDQRIRELDQEARRRGALLVNECGLDPGIDHMGALELIDRIRREPVRVLKFASYGGGLPAVDEPMNPLRYVITWNPRNLVMSGEGGAQYLVDDLVKVVPHHEVFHRTWRAEVPGVGTFEAYPNRDSLSYKSLYGLDETSTMLRGTLRYPGWCETWCQVVKLGLPNEQLRIPRLADRSWAELVEMFLPRDLAGVHLEQRVASYLGISPTGTILQNLRWLGLFDREPCRAPGESVAEALIHLLKQKLSLPAGSRDMVVLFHELVLEGRDGTRERIRSVMVEKGTADGMTAMAKTVGLPAALMVRLVLTEDLPMTGSYIPTHPALYKPLLKQLDAEGIRFREQRSVLEPDVPVS
ncbi:MAG: saccharopine dehydrogenase C-terminal domain-containing protein [Myxococcota bacterium]